MAGAAARARAGDARRAAARRRGGLGGSPPRGVEADRTGPRREQCGGHGRVDDRARAVLGDRCGGGPACGVCLREVGERERAQPPARCRDGRDVHRGAACPQRSRRMRHRLRADPRSCRVRRAGRRREPSPAILPRGDDRHLHQCRNCPARHADRGRLSAAACPLGLQQRVLAGLGLCTLVIGVDNALAWRDTNPLYVLGGVLLGGIVGRGDRDRAAARALGDRIQRACLAQRALTRQRGLRHGEPAVLRRPADGRRLDPGRPARRLPGACDEGPARRLRRRSRWPPRSAGASGSRRRPCSSSRATISLSAGLFDDVLTRREALAR